ncbi:hypothetical protein [Peribacillus frigoritolerans]|uniref:hypothetical protein n=1 Tax=Peribacillus frigoritolerans TaxID=450367 RepID=UPI003F815233
MNMSNQPQRIIIFNANSQSCLERFLPPQGCNFFPPCEPMIQMTISSGVDACTFNINGTATCSVRATCAVRGGKFYGNNNFWYRISFPVVYEKETVLAIS